MCSNCCSSLLMSVSHSLCMRVFVRVCVFVSENVCACQFTTHGFYVEFYDV